MLTVDMITKAMQGNAFWLQPGSVFAQVVEEATAKGYIRRISHTQVEWIEEGLAKARRELETPKQAPTITIEEAEKLVQEAYASVAPAGSTLGSLAEQRHRMGALDLQGEILTRLRALR